MDYVDFITLVYTNYAMNKNNGHQKWRLGQTMFNTLSVVRPELAERISGTSNDPFYAENKEDERFVNCEKFLQENW